MDRLKNFLSRKQNSVDQLPSLEKTSIFSEFVQPGAIFVIPTKKLSIDKEKINKIDEENRKYHMT